MRTVSAQEMLDDILEFLRRLDLGQELELLKEATDNGPKQFTVVVADLIEQEFKKEAKDETQDAQ